MPAYGVRALDIVVYGATGYTGRLVAQYLAERAPELRVGLAGRSLTKLHAVRGSLPSVWADIPLLVCSHDNKPSLAQVAVQTAVLISCAGPFQADDNGNGSGSGGQNVVEACVNNLTHYVDSTGEPAFVRDVIRRFHDKAQAAGVCIVPACGMDSLPWDVVVYAATHNTHTGRFVGTALVDRVEVYAELTNLRPSAGTLQSALTGVRDSNLLHEGKHLADAWLGKTTGSKHHARVALRPHYSTVAKAWVLPMLVTVDVAIARRTLEHTQAQDPYGEPVDVHVGQYLVVRHKLAPLLIALFAVFVLPLLFLVAKIPPLYALASRFIRKDGWEGPTPQERAAAVLKVTAVGSSASGVHSLVNLTAKDPGYGTTAKWIGESALLLLDKPKTSGTGGSTGGVLSPAAAFGQAIIDATVNNGIAVIDY